MRVLLNTQSYEKHAAIKYKWEKFTNHRQLYSTYYKAFFVPCMTKFYDTRHSRCCWTKNGDICLKKKLSVPCFAFNFFIESNVALKVAEVSLTS